MSTEEYSTPKPCAPFRPVVCATCLFIFGCGRAILNTNPVVIEGTTMGTTYSVKLVSSGDTKDPARFADAPDIARTVLQTIDNMMSTYKPDSELSRFNQHKDTSPFPVSREMIEVFTIARRISDMSGGAFDITVGPLVNAWGFGPENRGGKIPTDSEIDALKQRVGYTKIVIDSDASTLRKTQPDVYCDLSAIAKGYGVDQVAKALDSLGIANYLVVVGGEVRAKGVNAQGHPWQVAVEQPDAVERTPYRVVSLSNCAISTSGDYRNYFEKNGQRYSHEIDPKTGRPVTHRLASASVVVDTSAFTDAFATAMMVLGPEKAYDLALTRGLAVFLLIRREDGKFDERQTPAFAALLTAPKASVIQQGD